MISSARNRKVIESGAAGGGGITGLTGDVTATGPGVANATLASIVSAGSKGSATKIPIITIDAKGRVTVLTDVTVGQAPITGSSSSTGTVSNLAISGADIFYLDNASDLTLTGIVAGVDGQQVTLVSRGAGNVFLTHQATSTAANQFFNIITTGPTPLAANKGSATYEYDASISRWRLIAHEQGTYITPAFNAGDWSGLGAMTWTVASGDVVVDTYYVKGKSVTYLYALSTTTIGGTPNGTLQRAVPNGYTASHNAQNPNRTSDNGVVGVGRAVMDAPTDKILFFNAMASTSWTASTDNTGMAGQIIFEVD